MEEICDRQSKREAGHNENRDFAQTMRSTRACSAPSAMRMPISLRRRATLYDMTP